MAANTSVSGYDQAKPSCDKCQAEGGFFGGEWGKLIAAAGAGVAIMLFGSDTFKLQATLSTMAGTYFLVENVEEGTQSVIPGALLGGGLSAALAGYVVGGDIDLATIGAGALLGAMLIRTDGGGFFGGPIRIVLGFVSNALGVIDAFLCGLATDGIAGAIEQVGFAVRNWITGGTGIGGCATIKIDPSMSSKCVKYNSIGRIEGELTPSLLPYCIK